MSNLTVWALVGALGLLSHQVPAARTLSPANAKLSEDFSRIVGVRELKDGRVLVSDAGDKRVLVADFGKNSVAQVGREGRGPGEYTMASRLFPLGGDSTLMIDAANGRWLMFQAVQVAGILPPDHPAVTHTRGGFVGTDARGGILATNTPGLEGGMFQATRADSSRLFRLTLTSTVTDTIARLLMAPVTIRSTRDKDGKLGSVNIITPPWSAGESALLFPDGWIVVARLDPYRVDWRAPDGRWTLGKPLPFTVQPVTNLEKDGYITRRSSQTGKQVSVPDDAWPATIPPFLSLPLFGAPGGGVLIYRTPTALHPGNRYDVIDRTGRLTGWLELPASDRIAGFGAKSVYVIVTDDDGLQHLQRHPWS